MKKCFGWFMLLAVFITGAGCRERIDAGYEGIKVNLYGTGKGVSEATLVTGAVWYNPLTTDVVEYPVFFQTVDYEPFSINAKDGTVFTVDPSLEYRVKVGSSPLVYVKFRKQPDELAKTIIYIRVLDAFRNAFNEYTTDSILARRVEFDNKVTKVLRQSLDNEGFDIGQLTLGLAYPAAINEAIISKNKVQQRVLEKQSQLAEVRADSAITVVRAMADAKANELLSRGLTPAVLSKMAIEKWDGKAALYGQPAQFFKQVGN